MSVFSAGKQLLDSVFDVNGRSLDVAYDISGRAVFPSSKLTIARSYDLSKSWKFKLLTTETGKSVDVSSYVVKACDESGFENVDLPYDWSVR
jgi:hypothetical protein